MPHDISTASTMVHRPCVRRFDPTGPMPNILPQPIDQFDGDHIPERVIPIVLVTVVLDINTALDPVIGLQAGDQIRK